MKMIKILTVGCLFIIASLFKIQGIVAQKDSISQGGFRCCRLVYAVINYDAEMSDPCSVNLNRDYNINIFTMKTTNNDRQKCAGFYLERGITHTE